MKWAVGRLVLPDTQLQAGSVLIMKDDSYEFQMDFDTFKNSNDPRLLVARNALMRDYPEMATRIAVRRAPPPVEILRDMAIYAAQRQGTQAVIDGSGYVGPRGQVIQRPQQQQQNNSSSDDTDDTDNTPPKTKASSAPIGGRVVRLSAASTPYAMFE